MIATEFLCKVEVSLEPIRDLGDTPLGRRRIINITGGKFSGPRLSGRILAGGGSSASPVGNSPGRACRAASCPAAPTGS